MFDDVHLCRILQYTMTTLSLHHRFSFRAIRLRNSPRGLLPGLCMAYRAQVSHPPLGPRTTSGLSILFHVSAIYFTFPPITHGLKFRSQGALCGGWFPSGHGSCQNWTRQIHRERRVVLVSTAIRTRVFACFMSCTESNASKPIGRQHRFFPASQLVCLSVSTLHAHASCRYLLPCYHLPSLLHFIQALGPGARKRPENEAPAKIRSMFRGAVVFIRAALSIKLAMWDFYRVGVRFDWRRWAKKVTGLWSLCRRAVEITVSGGEKTRMMVGVSRKQRCRATIAVKKRCRLMRWYAWL
jgi:hypothetical protein